MTLSRRKAALAQRALSAKVIKEDLADVRSLKLICGLDVSYSKHVAVACCSMLSAKGLECVELRVIVDQVGIPYIPTFLAFREMPLYVKLCYDLRGRRDLVLMVDGHGLTHPRRLGIASHLGVALDVPTIGVAKKPLYGKLVKRGGVDYLYVDDEPVGAVIEVDGSRRLYVSIGHGVSLNTALKIVKTCIRGGRLPKPIEISDSYSRLLARGVKYATRRLNAGGASLLDTLSW